jgi:hypothetical protein
LHMQIGMPLELFMGLEFPMWTWLINNKFIYFIGLNHLTCIPNSWLH